MNTRIKEVREKLKLSQEEFGKKLGLTTSEISNIEVGEDTVTEKTEWILCKEFQVSYPWLCDGIGDMFNAYEADFSALCAGKLVDDDENPFYSVMKELIYTYMLLDSKDQTIINTRINHFLTAQQSNVKGGILS